LPSRATEPHVRFHELEGRSLPNKEANFMMRTSVVAAAVAAMVCAGIARAQAPQNENGGAVETAPPGGSGSVSTQGYSYQQSYTSGDAQAVPPGNSQQDIDRELRGTSVIVGGGVEGYTGSLAPRVGVGPAWNLIIGFHPSSVLGLELAYEGAVNSVKYGNFGLTTPGGADIVRNGGHAAVTLAFGPWRVQPFVLAGVGVDHSSVSDNARDVGFRSTTAGYIPVGGGIRGQMQGVVVDLRGNWELPFSDNLFPGGTGQNTLGLSTGNYGRWNATLNIGGAF
jgi:hypothetical protein